jgi:hypothetical protein
MAESSQPTVPSQPGGPVPGAGTAGAGSVLTRVLRALGSGLLALAAVVTGSLVFGLLAGFIWQLVAPRPLFVVVGRGAAAVVNPETGAFIAADGWFCVLAVAGGIVTGLLGYRFAVRCYGPLPMVGVLAGGLAAAFVTRWVGQRSGSAAFNARLGAARPGTLLHAPIMLGSAGALALWPLAAGVVAGGIEAAALLRDRRRVSGRHSGYGGSAGPGSYPGGSSSAGPQQRPWPGQSARSGESPGLDQPPSTGVSPRPATTRPGQLPGRQRSPGPQSPGTQSPGPRSPGPQESPWLEESPWPEQTPWPQERPWGGRPGAPGE